MGRMSTLGIDIDQLRHALLMMTCLLLTSSLAQPADESSSANECSSRAPCCIRPSISTVEYGQWLNLTFVVTPCNITDVHWYTTGDRRSLDNSDLLGNAQYQFMSGSCKDNVTEFQFNIRITEVTHGILNGAVFAFGDQRCFSLPSARYYIDSSPGPTSEDYDGMIASSLGIHSSTSANSSSVSALVGTRWTPTFGATLLSLTLVSY